MSGAAARGALTAGALAAAVGAPALAQNLAIGTVAAANQAVIGTPPEASQRTLQLGFEVIADERIETAAIGAGQFLFLDQTTLSVWPNSDIVLDRFVYDPDRGVGEMSVTLTRGVLRFIGGRISKTSDAEIRTPQGLVTVRGGIAHMVVGDGFTRVTHIAGETTRLGDLALSRPNATGLARLTPNGDVEVTYLGVLDAEGVSEIYGQAPGEGDGGLSDTPEDEQVAAGLEAAGALALGSGNPDAPTQRPISTLGEQQRDAGDDPALALAPSVDDRQIAGVVADAGQTLTPPDGPTPDRPLVTPLLGRVGVALFTGGGDALETLSIFNTVQFSSEAEGPEAGFSAIVAQAGGDAAPEDLAAAARAAGVDFAASPNAFLVARNESTGGVLRVESGLLSGQSAVVRHLSDVGDFFLAAFDSGSQQALLFFGEPTPAEHWRPTSLSGVRTQSYLIGADLFSGQAGPVAPDAEPAPFFDADRFELTLVSGVDGRYFAPFSGGPSRVGAGRAFAGFLGIVGEGAQQRSLFGAASGEILSTPSGQPSFAAPLLLTGRDGGTDAVDQSRVLLGALDGGTGATTFGPGGEWLVLGGSSAYATNDDPGPDGVPDFLSEDAPANVSEFAGARVQRVGGSSAVTSARATLGVTASQSGLPADSRLDRVLTGGYAVVGGNGAAVGGGVTRVDPYVLQTLGSDGVRVGFDVERNEVVAEINGLEDVGSESGLFGVNRRFGELTATNQRGGRSAFLTDRRFVALSTAHGEISGTGPGANGVPTSGALTPTGGLRAEPHGAFTTVETVGSAGLFSSAVDTNLAFLRWGWWSDEIVLGSDFPNSDRANSQQRLHLGGWVSGVVSDIAAVNAAMGSARYDGFALAHVTEGPVTYVDGGRAQLDYRFFDRSGELTITEILGQTFVFALSASGARPGNHFGGPLLSIDPDFQGFADGSFFSNGPDATAAVAGSFYTTAPSGGVLAEIGGIFGADRVGPLDPTNPRAIPLPGLIGARFFLDDSAPVAGVSAPASSNLVFTPAGPTDRLINFTRDTTVSPTILTGRLLSDGTEIDIDEAPVEIFDTLLPGFTVARIVAPTTSGDLFYLDAAATLNTRSLQLVGTPTPVSFFEPDATPNTDFDVTVYSLTDELFTFNNLPLPSAYDALFPDAENPALLVVGDPVGTAPLGSDATKLFIPVFAQEGDGVTQSITLGYYGAELDANGAGYPTATFAPPTRLFTRVGSGVTAPDVGAGLNRADVRFGLIDIGGGVTTVGGEADAFLLGQLSSTTPREATSGFLSPQPDSDAFGIFYGDTRLAIREQEVTLGLDRDGVGAPIGSPLVPAAIATNANPAIASVLTGGYAVAAVESLASEPYPLSTLVATDVRIGFAPGVNAVHVEFDNLNPVSGSFTAGVSSDAPVAELSLNFGGNGSNAVMVNDDVFGAREAFAPNGGLTRQTIAASNRTLAPNVSEGGAPRQDAFRGALLSEGATDPDRIRGQAAPTPEYLRWGYWAGNLRVVDPDLGVVASDRMGVSPYVAGVVSNIADVQAQSFTATYSGRAVANVFESSIASGGSPAVHLREGTFDMSYNFGQRSGALTINDIVPELGAASFSTPISEAGGSAGNHYGGSVNFSSTSVSAQGAFFTGDGDPVAATAGRFNISGVITQGTYQAVGVYGGDRVTP